MKDIFFNYLVDLVLIRRTAHLMKIYTTSGLKWINRNELNKNYTNEL